MKTIHPKKTEAKAARNWVIVDAEGKVLGKVATKVADLLRGKHKPTYHPAVDMGDNVIVINADKVVLTGQKEARKHYIHTTRYPGSLKDFTVSEMRSRHPERIIETAVKGMIPRNRMKKFLVEKLHVYAGAEHPHVGQNPQTITIE